MLGEIEELPAICEGGPGKKEEVNEEGEGGSEGAALSAPTPMGVAAAAFPEASGFPTPARGKAKAQLLENGFSLSEERLIAG